MNIEIQIADENEPFIEFSLINIPEESRQVGFCGEIGELAAFKTCPECEKPARQYNSGGFACRNCSILIF